MNAELFLSFLAPIADRFSDDSVNELRLNPNGTVYEERAGIISRIQGLCLSQDQVEFAVSAVSGEMNLPLDERHPKLDARLEDGSRIAILGPPVIAGGYAVTIRRFPQPFSLARLVNETGTLTSGQAALVSGFIRDRKTVLISGSTRAGKTTFARVLLNLIPHPGDKLVLIEQPAELNLRNADSRDIIAMEVSDSSEPDAFTVRQAVRAALRHSPDRIVIGELRGAEAADFLDALNTGHTGSLSTLHANSAADALVRLATLVRRGEPTLSHEVIVDLIARSIDVVIHLDRSTGRRVVTEIVTTAGVSEDRRRVMTQPVEGGSLGTNYHSARG